MIQGSAEWHRARLGKVTASRVHDIVATGARGQALAGRAQYFADLLEERLTGRASSTFVNDAMRWGMEKEPQAVAAYAFVADVEPEECGFFDHPEIEMAGASPDRLIGPHGLVEVKCPTTKTHIALLQSGVICDRHQDQMQWQLACTERLWCDYVSFDPRIQDERLRLFVRRVERDDERIADLNNAVLGFLAEIDAGVEALQSKYGSGMVDAATEEAA